MAPLDHDDDGLALWIARKIAGTETEARDLVEEARVHAGALLAEYRSAVERVAHALLLQRELDGAEVASLIKGETRWPEPRRRPREPAPVMECVLAFSYDSPEWGGAPRTIGVGTKLRADHEAVRVGGANHWVSPDTPDDERPRMEDFIGDGVQTVHRPVPDGWRRDLHGHGRPFDQQ